MKKPLKRWLALVALGVIGGLLLSGSAFLVLLVWDETGPAQSQVCCSTPADWGFDYRDVQLAGHGETLAGWYIPSRTGSAVILLHSGGIHRMGVEREARVLAAQGHGILMYDRRAHGESTGELNSHGWRDVEDVPAALAFLRRQDDVDAERIGVFGASIGGQVALRSAAMFPELRAVWADGPSLCGGRDHLPLRDLPREYWGQRFASWLATPLFELRLGMRTPPSVVDVIGDIAPRPVFLVATEDIERRFVGRYFEYAGEPKTLWEIPEANHGGGFGARPEEYREKLVGFFEETLAAGPELRGRRPEPPDVELLASARALLGEDGRRETCGPYALYSDASDPRAVVACDRLAAGLDDLYLERYGVRPRGVPAEAVVLFEDVADYRAFARAGGVPAGYAGYTLATRGLAVFYLAEQPFDEFLTTLAHELTHLLHRRALGVNLPPWLSEGLADGIGDTAIEDGFRPLTGVAGTEAQAERLRRAMVGGRAGGLELLVSLKRSEFDRGSRPHDYEQSALFVRFLLLDPDLAPGFRSYLRGFAGGRESGPEALAGALGVGWEELDRRFEAWVREAR